MNLFSKQDSLNRNLFHLFGFVSTSAMFLFWLFTGIAAEYGFDLTNHNTSFGVWLAVLIIILLANIAIGILQVKFDQDKSRNYVGYFTIFVSPLFFPIFASLTMYLRSGLSAKRQDTEIRKYIVDNISVFEKSLPDNNIKLSKEVQKQIDEVTSLQQKQMLDTHNGNAYKLAIIESELPFAQWPKIWDNKELIAIANDIQQSSKSNNKQKTTKRKWPFTLIAK